MVIDETKEFQNSSDNTNQCDFVLVLFLLLINFLSLFLFLFLLLGILGQLIERVWKTYLLKLKYLQVKPRLPANLPEEFDKALG